MTVENRPVVFYVDDEPRNLTVFEAALPDTWDIHVYDNALAAIKDLDKLTPSVVVSDQRMPQMNGVEFLELTQKVLPDSVRIIATGYSDEDLVIQSVRRAKIFDYIKKPWDVDDLEHRITNALLHYQSQMELKQLRFDLDKREMALKDQNQKLLQTTLDLEMLRQRERTMIEELKCWVPPFVLWAIEDKTIQFPIQRDIVGIAFDIINSGALHSQKVDGRSVRSMIIQSFTESLMKYGGWRESHQGDSAYGHFGLVPQGANPYEAAIAVAREFRVNLRSISRINQVDVECGIGLHVAKGANISLHTVQLNTSKGLTTQKSFDTTSVDVDLLHRMEKLVHHLPGTNIIMSQDFYSGLTLQSADIIPVGSHYFPKEDRDLELFVIKSDIVTPESLSDWKRLQIISEKKLVAA